MWPEEQQLSDRRRERATILDRNPEGGGVARPVGRPRVPAATSDRRQPEAEGHPVRRLPRPRLELPRRLQARPQGQPARRRGQHRARRRRPTSSSKRGPPVDIHVDTACNAPTATSRRTATATAASTARSPTRSRSAARTATAPPTPIRRCAPPARRRRRGGTDLALLRNAGRPAALRVAAAASSIQRSMRRPEAASGR